MAGELALLVDDNPRNLRLARDVLELAGFRTAEATTGTDGIRLAHALAPDVVLMDIRLPDLDGAEVTRRLKADPRTAAIPVIALTSLAMKGDREWLLASGFDGYLEKPIDVRSFGDDVRRHCRRASR